MGDQRRIARCGSCGWLSVDHPFGVVVCVCGGEVAPATYTPEDLPSWVCECDRPDRNDGDEWHRWNNACAMWAEIADRLRTVRREELS